MGNGDLRKRWYIVRNERISYTASGEGITVRPMDYHISVCQRGSSDMPACASRANNSEDLLHGGKGLDS